MRKQRTTRRKVSTRRIKRNTYRKKRSTRRKVSTRSKKNTYRKRLTRRKVSTRSKKNTYRKKRSTRRKLVGGGDLEVIGTAVELGPGTVGKANVAKINEDKANRAAEKAAARESEEEEQQEEEEEEGGQQQEEEQQKQLEEQQKQLEEQQKQLEEQQDQQDQQDQQEGEGDEPEGDEQEQIKQIKNILLNIKEASLNEINKVTEEEVGEGMKQTIEAIKNDPNIGGFKKMLMSSFNKINLSLQNRYKKVAQKNIEIIYNFFISDDLKNLIEILNILRDVLENEKYNDFSEMFKFTKNFRNKLKKKLTPIARSLISLGTMSLKIRKLKEPISQAYKEWTESDEWNKIKTIITNNYNEDKFENFNGYNLLKIIKDIVNEYISIFPGLKSVIDDDSISTSAGDSDSADTDDDADAYSDDNAEQWAKDLEEVAENFEGSEDEGEGEEYDKGLMDIIKGLWKIRVDEDEVNAEIDELTQKRNEMNAEIDELTQKREGLNQRMADLLIQVNKLKTQ
jgi:hypothetical protein